MQQNCCSINPSLAVEPCNCRPATCPQRPLADLLPAGALADASPALPELGEPDLVRHFVNLSTLKHVGRHPPVSAGLVYNEVQPQAGTSVWPACPAWWNLHPYQPQASMQGLLGILYQCQQMLAEIAGLEAVFVAAGRRCPW